MGIDTSVTRSIHAVCAFGDLCRIVGVEKKIERLGNEFVLVRSVRRLVAAAPGDFDVTGVLGRQTNGYLFLNSPLGTADNLVIPEGFPLERTVRSVCAEGDICRVRGKGTRDPSWRQMVMPSELHEVELVQRARLVTVEMTGVYSGGSAGNFDVVGDEEDQFLDGLERFAHTPVGRTMPSCERYRVVALVRDTDPHRVVDLLAVGCARPDQDDIPAAVEGGPQ
ncbi:hypothetical protein RVX_R00940 [Nitratidesulfovibrio sp. HK-II]|uniref:hypothetical protein n=1 Tax=Nitratidesulfovibrio sp. HK-II TaxID=2009266 RepID=UPI0011C0469D|nr:hypothetical protein [Nitratidesulfovibrio sp. HK-II]